MNLSRPACVLLQRALSVWGRHLLKKKEEKKVKSRLVMSDMASRSHDLDDLFLHATHCFRWVLPILFWKKRERERGTDGQTDRETDRDTEREGQPDRQRKSWSVFRSNYTSLCSEWTQQICLSTLLEKLSFLFSEWPKLLLLFDVQYFFTFGSHFLFQMSFGLGDSDVFP